jgi:hypothetical protein
MPYMNHIWQILPFAGLTQEDRVKNSGVYLNQLMSFASVSGCVVTSVMQAESRRDLSWAMLGHRKGDAELSNFRS